MKKWIFSLITLMLISSSVFAMTPDEKAAQTVIENWFAAMKSNEVEKAGTYLSPQFVSIHTDRIVRNKEQEISLIKNLHMRNYKLSHFKFSHSGDVIVVTYIDQSNEQIDNKAIDTKPAGRMAVLQKKDDKWLILAYANLDKIS